MSACAADNRCSEICVQGFTKSVDLIGPELGATEAPSQLAPSLTAQSRNWTYSLAQPVPQMTESQVPQGIERPRNPQSVFQFDSVESSGVPGFGDERRFARESSWLYLVGSPTYRSDRDLTISDLLPGKYVTAVIESLSQMQVGRKRTQQGRWRKLLEIASGRNGEELGFIRLKSGVRQLAKRMSVPHTSLWRDLLTLQEAKRIRLWKESRSGNETVVGIQVIALTEWLVWVSAKRAAAHEHVIGAATFPQIKRIFFECLEAGFEVPMHIDSRASAIRVIDQMNQDRGIK